MDLATLSALWYIDKYKDYSLLIKLFKENPALVIESKELHEIIVGLASGDIVKVKGRRNTPEKDARSKFLVNLVYTYEFFGFHLYSSDTDTENIANGESPKSAVAKAYCQYNRRRGELPFVSYETLKGYVRKANKENKSNRQKFSMGLVTNLFDVYEQEREDIDISKAKANAKGTIFDEEVYPEFWEEFI